MEKLTGNFIHEFIAERGFYTRFHGYNHVHISMVILFYKNSPSCLAARENKF